MKFYFTFFLVVSGFFSQVSLASTELTETVYVETPLDSDQDGKLDRIYVSITRPEPEGDKKLSTIFKVSPYALGGNDVPMHEVDLEFLPQENVNIFGSLFSSWTHRFNSLNWLLPFQKNANSTLSFGKRESEAKHPYARLRAHSLGTGYSTGCPSVGDVSEALAAKAVIDWLNGRARAFDSDGGEVVASWSNGGVAMMGVSYDGTLPIMVATTGVTGLKAIIPIAAISNWYDYYRANGLVVHPGGYAGEDADILGHYIVRKDACSSVIAEIAKQQARESGDYTPFWEARNYVPKLQNIRAATFIIHGQNDWNVKQKHAIQLWEGIAGAAPRRMFLHRGGHGSTEAHGVPDKIQAWIDHFLEGDNNGITDGPSVEVELPNRELMSQEEWPHEGGERNHLYFGASNTLTSVEPKEEQKRITDLGAAESLEGLAQKPDQDQSGRLIFLTSPFESGVLLTGTTTLHLSFSVLNQKSANFTAALVEYDSRQVGKIITRGWVDPQNATSLSEGGPLVPGENYSMSFNLEPKQYRLAPGSRLGVLIASTDRDYTLRPKAGTEILVNLGKISSLDITLVKIQ